MIAHIDAPQHGCALRVVDTALELVVRQFTELCSDLGGPLGAAAGAGWCGGHRSHALLQPSSGARSSSTSRTGRRFLLDDRGFGADHRVTVDLLLAEHPLEELLQGAVLH